MLSSRRRRNSSGDRGDKGKAFGTFLLVNGVNTKLLMRNLKPLDIIGIAFDSEQGIVNFDLNTVDLNVNYQHHALKINEFFPTADLGLKHDSVKILPPPASALLSLYNSPEIRAIFQRDTVKLLQKVDKIRQSMKQQPVAQMQLF